MNKVFKIWLSPKIPKEHCFIKTDNLSFILRIRKFLVHWFIHPVKRRIARYYCFLLQRMFGMRVIAITGSSGKSTTKEMLASILKLKAKTVYSFKNIDPIYNIPTTILKCTPLTKYLILEMGVEFPGEMDFYLWLVKPDISIITSIYPTHTEFFEDISGVYKEKIKLAEAVINNGSVILNKESKYLDKYSKNKKNIILYGKGSPTYFSNIKFSLKGTIFDLVDNGKKLKVNLPSFGKVNILNSLASFSAARVLNVDQVLIKKGLEDFKPLDHRLTVFKKGKALIIDDTYNSNPEALKESLEVFKFFSKNKVKVLVIGDMLELGKLSKKFHLEVSKELLKTDFDLLVCVGKESKIINDSVKSIIGKNKSYWVQDQKSVDKFIKPFLIKDSIFFFKGSHSIGLDNLVDRLFK
ncbi:UDP-N-acetylmuramoyl-tripeptide--D-alanyl-D-alanine ligase [Patescibacteria group bacterium]